jgi:hypothetical protein
MNDDGIIAKTMSLWVFISEACPICHLQEIIVWVPPKPAFAATEVKFHGPYNKRTRLFLFFCYFLAKPRKWQRMNTEPGFLKSEFRVPSPPDEVSSSPRRLSQSFLSNQPQYQ